MIHALVDLVPVGGGTTRYTCACGKILSSYADLGRHVWPYPLDARIEQAAPAAGIELAPYPLKGCAIAACPNPIRREAFLCVDHLAELPPELRARVEHPSEFLEAYLARKAALDHLLKRRIGRKRNSPKPAAFALTLDAYLHVPCQLCGDEISPAACLALRWNGSGPVHDNCWAGER